MPIKNFIGKTKEFYYKDGTSQIKTYTQNMITGKWGWYNVENVKKEIESIDNEIKRFDVPKVKMSLAQFANLVYQSNIDYRTYDQRRKTLIENIDQVLEAKVRHEYEDEDGIKYNQLADDIMKELKSMSDDDLAFFVEVNPGYIEMAFEYKNEDDSYSVDSKFMLLAQKLGLNLADYGINKDTSSDYRKLNDLEYKVQLNGFKDIESFFK